MEHQQELADTAERVSREGWFTRANMAKAAGVAAVGVAVGVGATWQYLEHASSDVRVAGTRMTVEPQFAPYATIDGGSLSVRLPLDVPLPLGAVVTLHEGLVAPDGMSERLSSPDVALTATAQLQDVVAAQYKRAAGWGGLAGILAGAATPWAWRRRQDIIRQVRQANPRYVAAGAAALALGGAFVGSWEDKQVEPGAWAPVRSFVPQEYQSYLDSLPPEFVNAELRGPVKLTGKGHEQIMVEVDKFIEKNFREPLEFVKDASANVAALAAETPSKPDGAFRVAVLSDMHDNFFMADVWGKAINAYEVDGVIDAGDTTGIGNEWEAFSARAVEKNTVNVPFRAYIEGNHDKAVALKPYDEAGFIHPQEGKPVQFGPLTLAAKDSNTYTPLNGPNEILQPFDEASEMLKENSCNSDTVVNLIVTHKPWPLTESINAGCGQINVSGHMHTARAPEYHQNEDGTSVYSVQNGTSGGAEWFISIGKPKPERPAGITMIDYQQDEQGEWYPTNVRQVTVQNSGAASAEETALEPTVTFQDVRAAVRAAEADLAPQAMR